MNLKKMSYLIAAMLSSTTAIAQIPKTETTEKIEVEAKKTPSQKTVTLNSAGLPTKVTTIDREEIDRTNVGRDIGNLLRRVPGIMAHNLNQGDTGTSIKMRGFLSATHGADAAVTVDGAAQNVPSAIINHGMNDLSWLIPEMIERIEVVKGPFSALYGDQNRSGAINIVTRSKSDNSVAVSAGSFGLARATGVYSGAAGAVQLFIVADHFEMNSYRKNADQDRDNLMVKASVQDGSGSQWAVRANYQKSDWNGSGFLNINRIRAGLDQETARDPLGPPLFGSAERLSVVGTLTPSGTERGLYATVFYEEHKRRRVTAANLTDLNVADDDRNIYGARGLYNFTFGKSGALTVGADVRKDVGDAISRRWLAGVPSANFNANQDLDLLTYGLFVQGQFKIIDSLKVVGGVRRDAFDYDIKNRKLPAASLSYNKSVTTPRIGLVWSPASTIDIFVNQGQGFRSPSQAELSPSGAVGPLGALGGASNASIVPSKVKTYDYGFNATLAARWTASGAVYHTLNQNEIIQVSPGVFASVGNTTRDGWELETRLGISDALNIYASFGRITKAEINNPLPNTANQISVPKDTIKVGASYSLPLDKATLLFNADAFYISGIPFFQGTPLTRSFSRPYSKYDLRTTYDTANWQLTASLTLQPHKLSSEVAFGSVAGLLIDPRPRTEGVVSLRYRF